MELYYVEFIPDKSEFETPRTKAFKINKINSCFEEVYYLHASLDRKSVV